MDAQTVAAAALAVVVDDSREAAVRELLLERERLAMAVADRDSFLAQRHSGSTVSWRALYEVLRDDLELAHADLDLARDAMRGVLRHLEAGRARWAKAMLSEQLDSYEAASPDDEARDGDTAVALDRLPGEVGSVVSGEVGCS